MSDILYYQNLTDPQISQLNKEHVIVILPISLMEAHGPHLPLGTDFLIAAKFSELLAARLTQFDPQTRALIMPAVPMGVGGINRPGTLAHEQNLIKNTLFQFGRQLADHGFKKGIIVSGHAGKAHLQAMSSAARNLKKQSTFEFLPLTSYLFLDAGLKKMARMIGQSGNDLPPYDGHAGLWETSVMMFLHPEQVDSRHKSLPESDDAEENGYRGNPALANVETGQKLIGFLLDIAQMIVNKHFFEA